jgi:4-amino-4-deoxy-L-arabinose transferase-like glycosyltransferase
MHRFLLALTATGIALFALIKPVHIDDTVVLHVAANILRDPLRPFAGEFFWLEEPQPLAKVTTNPPLVSYWLAPWIALAGYREWVLHLSFAPFVALLMWGMHRLATRWLGAEWAWWAVGWLMLSPAVLPGMNLMRDVPALALLVGGLACWVEGVERRGARWLAAGALLVGLAGLAKYTALIGLPLVALYTVLRRAYGALGWLTLALVPIAGWSALNLWADGEVHLVYLWQERRGSAPLGAKLLPGVVGLGASTLLWLGVRRRFKAALGDGWRWKVALLALAAAGVVGWYHLQFAGQPMYLQSLLWLVAGVIVLGLAVGVGWFKDSPPSLRFPPLREGNQAGGRFSVRLHASRREPSGRERGSPCEQGEP